MISISSRPPARIGRTSRVLAIAAALLLAACSTDDVAAPAAPVQGSFTVDARTSRVFINLADSVTVDSTTATNVGGWDIAFQATNVFLGPAVTGHCLCQNSALAPTNEQWLSLSLATEGPDFDAITAVPPTASFTADVFTTAPYYKYNLAGDHRITPTFDVYLIKRGTTVYKLQITSYYNETGTARFISFRYARIAG